MQTKLKRNFTETDGFFFFTEKLRKNFKLLVLVVKVEYTKYIHL